MSEAEIEPLPLLRNTKGLLPPCACCCWCCCGRRPAICMRLGPVPVGDGEDDTSFCPECGYFSIPAPFLTGRPGMSSEISTGVPGCGSRAASCAAKRPVGMPGANPTEPHSRKPTLAPRCAPAGTAAAAAAGARGAGTGVDVAVGGAFAAAAVAAAICSNWRTGWVAEVGVEGESLPPALSCSQRWGGSALPRCCRLGREKGLAPSWGMRACVCVCVCAHAEFSTINHHTTFESGKEPA
eukprot:1139991-Pelagomonas_calceolata.AAC.4